MTQDPNLWDERRGFEVVGRAGSPAELSRGLSILPGGELRGSDAAERTCDLIEQLPEERTESLGGLRLRLRGFPSGNDVDGVIILTLIGPCLTRLVTTCAKKYHSLKTPKTPFCGIRP